MAYTLAPLRAGFDHAVARALVEAAANPDGWPCWNFSNHDVVRTATRWSPGGVPDAGVIRLLLALLLTLRGSACLYQGEELGLPEADLPFEALRDPFGIAFWPDFAGRDGSRTPMPWDAALPHAGFTTGTPWLPVPDAHRALSVSAQQAPGSILAFTHGLLAARRASPALVAGSLRPIDLPAPLLGFEREEGPDRVRCLFNLSADPVPLPEGVSGGAALTGSPVPPAEGALHGWGVSLARV